MMDDLTDEEKQNISKFIEYSLMLIVKGFDEMEMNKRLELVKLFGSVINIGFNKTYLKTLDLEKRVKELEEKNKKK